MKNHIILNYIIIPGLLIVLMNKPANAQTNNWPLTPTNVTHAIWTGYGQNEGYHHEGLDLIGDSARIVVAIEAGRIRERNSSGGQNRRLTITRGADTTRGILYMHIYIAKCKYDTTRIWRVGDSVVQGDTLGYIYKYGSVHAHTHVEWVNKENPVSWDTTGNGPTQADWLESREPDKQGNLIDLLNPSSDAYPPVIFRPVRYRDAAGEGSATALYFQKSTACGDTVIKGNTDIVAKARDQFALYGALNFDISVKKMQFSIFQYKPGTGSTIVPLTTPFNYSGRFMQAGVGNRPADGPTRNSEGKFRNATLVWVDHENDNTCNTVSQSSSGTSNTGVYFYIPTNKNYNDSIQEWDATRYWDTNGKSGDVWNDSLETPAHEADSNKNAAFPDGRYIVRLKVNGYGSNASDTAALNDTIFVNNFNEVIYSCDAAGKDKDTFCIGQPVYIKGRGYPQTRSFRVYVIKDTTWVTGRPMLAAPYRVADTTVTTDANGRFGPIKIWNAYAPNSNPDKGYDIVLDYDSDSLYTDTIDGLLKTVDTKDENLPGNKGIIGSDSMKVKVKAEDVKCFGDSNGCVKVTITGGLKPYKIRIRGTGLDTTITDTVYCNLKAGKYLVTVIGKDSCQVTNDSVEIKQPAKMQLQKNKKDVSCSGACDGYIELYVSGGVPPYRYYWNIYGGDPYGDSVITNLCPGWYMVTVYDSNDCMITDTTIITQPDPIMIWGNSTPDSCDAGIGSITITVSGGTPSYTCSWGGSGSCTGLTGLHTGYYTVVVTDSAGCMDSATFFVPNYCDTMYTDTLETDTIHPDTIIYTDTTFAKRRQTSVMLKHLALEIQRVQPNPFGRSTDVYYTLREKGTARITLTDISGKKVFDAYIQAAKGVNIYRLADTDGLAKGVYLLHIESNNSTATIRISKE